jgi:hypothetical protein
MGDNAGDDKSFTRFEGNLVGVRGVPRRLAAAGVKTRRVVAADPGEAS